MKQPFQLVFWVLAAITFFAMSAGLLALDQSVITLALMAFFLGASLRCLLQAFRANSRKKDTLEDDKLI